MTPAAIRITDPDDPRLDEYRLLHDARARRRMEEPGPEAGPLGYFVAEGTHSIERLLGSGRRVRSILVDDIRLDRLADQIDGLAAPVYVAEPPVIKAAAGFDVHRGALATAERWPLPDPATVLAGARRVAVLEGLNDNENLGVLFRNAAGLGIEGVLLCPRCADPLYRRSVRVSMGHVITLPWARLDPWPDGLAEVRAAGFTLAALTPTGAAPIGAFPTAAHPRLAVLIGAEGPGLSPAALAAADHRLAIPMRAGADSLNVASAAAVAFFALAEAPASHR